MEQRQPTASNWWTVEEAAQHAKVSKKTIYAAAKSGRLRVAIIGGRRELRIRGPEWVDAWLEQCVTPQEIIR